MKILIESIPMLTLPLVFTRGKIKLLERPHLAKLGEALEKVDA
jgi:hypothetical protein